MPFGLRSTTIHERINSTINLVLILYIFTRNPYQPLSLTIQTECVRPPHRHTFADHVRHSARLYVYVDSRSHITIPHQRPLIPHILKHTKTLEYDFWNICNSKEDCLLSLQIFLHVAMALQQINQDMFIYVNCCHLLQDSQYLK